MASKLTASAPTPDGLVAALGTLLSSPTGALGVVLRNVKTPAPSIAASALDPSKSPLAFDSAHGPSGFSSATFADLAVQNEIPQATGAVRIVDGAGNVVFLPLEELRIQILPDATCGSVTGFVTANIPTSSGSAKLVIDGATKTLLDLAGPPGGGGQGMALYWQLRLELTAAAAPFDFSTLPP